MIPNPQTRHHGSFLLGRVWLRLTPDIPLVGDCFVDVAEFVATVFRQNQALRFWQNLGARSGCPVKSAPVRTTDIAMHLHGPARWCLSGKRRFLLGCRLVLCNSGRKLTN